MSALVKMSALVALLMGSALSHEVPLLDALEAAEAFLGPAIAGQRSFSSSPMALPRSSSPVFRPRSGLSSLQMANRESRHKEFTRGKKFRTIGTSSIARHYALQGRGGGMPRVHPITGKPLKPLVLPVARCMLLGKMANTRRMKRSFSMKATHKPQKVNLQWKRMWWEEGNRFVRLRVSVKGLRTIRKYGLDKAARKFGLDLSQRKLWAGTAPLQRGGRRRRSGEEGEEEEVEEEPVEAPEQAVLA
ncbi:unnamed protein product [Vitrella brassicaformis CCMP3155]|uniref:50S ribosomal protein L28 n=2 Tax=Vitrella brassicaformis TaxID=1169539 RepID=A0A0G4EWP8_VITBC|nr:unnamed protein product [Vitrella brassicaformis CCMP3155]|mmetsp:Transcript_14298/g.34099  ORF Transcript_14298/g.34099 Transcript_14298/m.34099 type:complete len:246 (+) Transcript_14298:74-811(+)|eukprot:CEM03173.1 unnamed protein product [Vitrella brassicaformis CCMP3155]